MMHGRYVPPANSVRPLQQSTIDLLTMPDITSAATEQLPAFPSKLETSVSTPPQAKKTLFSAIIAATVEVDRVTRQSVKTVKHTFEPPHISAMRTLRQKRLVRTFYTVGAISFIFAITLGLKDIFVDSRKPKSVNSVLGAATDSQNDATRNSEMPAENKPTAQDIATYLVAPEYPRYLRIPSIQVATRIRRLGLDSKGAVGTPNNINDAGWYDSSVKPGDNEGASVIEGHVAGPTQHGVFWDLNKLVYGDVIEIEKGSGEIITYKVTKTEKVPASQLSLSKYLAPEIPNHHDLKLVTAAGKYNIINGVYDTRLVVYAQKTP